MTDDEKAVYSKKCSAKFYGIRCGYKMRPVNAVKHQPKLKTVNRDKRVPVPFTEKEHGKLKAMSKNRNKSMSLLVAEIVKKELGI